MDKTLVNVLDHVDYCAALDAVVEFLRREVNADVPETYWGSCASRAMEVLVALSGSEEWGRVSEIIEEYEIKGAKNSTPMPGLGEFIQKVAKYEKKAIVTLLGSRATDIVLKKHGIDVEAVVARDKRLRPKPYPDQVLEALKLLKANPSETVMIGDSEWDERAAVSAGVRFIGITNGRTEHHFNSSLAVVDNLYQVCDVLEDLTRKSLI